MQPTWRSADLPGAWVGWVERNDVSEVPASFHPSPAAKPLHNGFETLSHTSVVQGVRRVYSVLDRICLGPAAGGVEPWQEVYPQDLSMWTCPSPHILPADEVHVHGRSTVENLKW